MPFSNKKLFYQLQKLIFGQNSHTQFVGFFQLGRSHIVACQDKTGLFGDTSHVLSAVLFNDLDAGKILMKLLIKSSDFSGVMPAYNAASYDYVMKNLYEESIGDKKKLEKKLSKKARFRQ